MKTIKNFFAAMVALAVLAVNTIPAMAAQVGRTTFGPLVVAMRATGAEIMLSLRDYCKGQFVMHVVPSLEELKRYNVNRPDQVEALRSSLYDSLIYDSAGQTQLKFFQSPQGQNGKSLADTNMTLAGTLAAPQSFLVETIELYFLPSVVPGTFGAAAAADFVNDVYDFAKVGGWLDFFIGSKSYLQEAPLMKFPPRAGLSVSGALADTTTAAASRQSMIQYASVGGPVYELDPPILLVPMQNFNISLNWPEVVPLSADATVLVQLGGILYRNSQ